MSNPTEKLYIRMLGACELEAGGKIISDSTIRSKKLWMPLQYLITFRNREITQYELIDLVYPEGKSDNPGNALKTLIHRIRNMLDELEYMEGREMIVQSRGTYAWNNSMNFTVDVDEFENLCNAASSPVRTEDEKLDFYLEAIAMYKDDFLPKSSLDSWVMQLSAYYHNLYIKAVQSVVEIFKQRGRYDLMLDILEQAIVIDPYDESLYYNLILAHINLKDPKTALSKYEKMKNLFFKEFGITPSKELIELYREIIKSNRGVEVDLSVIKEDLREPNNKDGAYFCEYEIFKDIYRLEVRTSSRTGETVFLCLVTMAAKPDGVQPTVKQVNNYTEKLSECIRVSLRRCDVYAKYSVSQFILMLPTTTYRNCELVMSRLLKRFNREYPRCGMDVNYSIQPLDVLL